jgi:2-C-methyl-D-erythritol 4-phosphate cytidylyltransferase
MIWGAIIVAAGRGTRFGAPKQLLDLAGKPLVAWSVETLAAMPEIVELVVVTESEFIDRMVRAVAPAARVLTPHVVAGGATRQESVRLGLAALPAHCAGILVHDGARPLVRAHEIRAGMRVVRPGRGSLLAAPVIDTIKVVDGDRNVTRTLDRATLWAAQTPQFAAGRDLRRVHADALRLGWPDATDDAALLERGGVDVTVVPASAENFKVTLPGDLLRAETIVRARGLLPLADVDIMLVECYVPATAVDAVLTELESRAARIDGVDRDLPAAEAAQLFPSDVGPNGDGRRLHALAGEDALFTTHLSHTAAHV